MAASPTFPSLGFPVEPWGATCVKSGGGREAVLGELWPPSRASAVVIVHVYLGVDRALQETHREVWSDLLGDGDLRLNT